MIPVQSSRCPIKHRILVQRVMQTAVDAKVPFGTQFPSPWQSSFIQFRPLHVVFLNLEINVADKDMAFPFIHFITSRKYDNSPQKQRIFKK